MMTLLVWEAGKCWSDYDYTVFAFEWVQGLEVISVPSITKTKLLLVISNKFIKHILITISFTEYTKNSTFGCPVTF